MRHLLLTTTTSSHGITLVIVVPLTFLTVVVFAKHLERFASPLFPFGADMWCCIGHYRRGEQMSARRWNMFFTPNTALRMLPIASAES